MSLLEVVASMAVMSLGLLGVGSTIFQTSHLQDANHEKVLVYNACRKFVEQLKGEDLATLVARYNDDPCDDPVGTGTAPGSTFTIGSLKTLDAPPVARVSFPTEIFQKAVMTANGVLTDPRYADLGLVDADGDGKLDPTCAASVTRSIVPLRIKVTWKDNNGPCSIEFDAIVAED